MKGDGGLQARLAAVAEPDCGTEPPDDTVGLVEGEVPQQGANLNTHCLLRVSAKKLDRFTSRFLWKSLAFPVDS